MLTTEWALKVALVVGATSGIGEATARAFCDKGAKVILAGRSRTAGEAIASSLRDGGCDARFEACDITDPVGVDAMFDGILSRYGRLDYAVNNAGHTDGYIKFADLSDGDWDRAINSNLRGTWLCMKREIRQMVAQGGGAIVNTSSLSAIKGPPGYSAYAAAKYGVNGLTTSAAVEVARRGIRVNAVMPGVIQTPMVDASLGAEGLEWALGRIPMRRAGRPEEVASVITWLCSDEASYVTGALIPVDGGMAPS